MAKIKHNFIMKIDDALLYLLKEYHDVSASEAMTFFHDRVGQMKDLPANITEKSKPSNIKFHGLDNRTVQVRPDMNRHYQAARQAARQDDPRFYVLRGFYPESNIPFKLIAVYSNEADPILNYPLHVKIIMGMKPHWSLVDSDKIDAYKEHIANAILLDDEIKAEFEIEYKYRNFKCMRPKGMELYRERNYECKKRDKAKVRRKVRQDAKQSTVRSDISDDELVRSVAHAFDPFGF